MNVFGLGNDHVFAMDKVLFFDFCCCCCMAFKSVTAAFQLRVLSKVDSIVEQVTTSGDILSFCKGYERKGGNRKNSRVEQTFDFQMSNMSVSMYDILSPSSFPKHTWHT